ncbi:Fcf2 pre-rRNA processing-domain-containing protein [Mortierella sp. GBAus27b]|nr:Fcf2 pre-rRNA processing-domain-containing protein [Mortierella sp. GBAus27b]
MTIKKPVLVREGSETVESSSPTSTLESSSPPPEPRNNLVDDNSMDVAHHQTVEGPHSTDDDSEDSREQRKRPQARSLRQEHQKTSNNKVNKVTNGKDERKVQGRSEDDVVDSENNDDDYEDDDDDLDQLLVKAQQSLKIKAMFVEKSDEPKFNFPKLETGLDTKTTYIKQHGAKAKFDMNTVVVVDKDTKGSKPTQQPTTLETCEVNMNAHKVHVSKKQKQEEREKTAGKGWFDLPQQILTPELKRDLQILKLRNVLDPKRFYKREEKGKTKFPKYFQIGTVIEGNTEFYSSRLTKKERATTITGEVMKDLTGRDYYKRKFDEIQEAKQSGGKRFYKKGKGKQSKSWRAGK